MEKVKRSGSPLRLRPLPPGGLPPWLKAKLAGIMSPTASGIPDINVVASSLLHDRQALRWALSRFKTADRIHLAVFARFTYKWQMYAATYYARRLAGVPIGNSKPQVIAKRLKGDTFSPTLATRLKAPAIPKKRRTKTSLDELMRRVSTTFFRGQPIPAPNKGLGAPATPGWCYKLLAEDMRCIRNWKHRRPVVFQMLVTGKLPKGLLGK